MMKDSLTIFGRPEALSDNITSYCPVCTHGVIHRLVAETIDELGIRERTVGVAPVGCSVFAYNYFNVDFMESPHGRAPALATAFKRLCPDMIVFTYQGDGDLASIGVGEIIHSANRGEKFTVIFVNNAIYGMTGGQMAPTTMPHQKTTTTPMGRDVATAGYPIRIAELLSSLRTPAYIARAAVHTPLHIIDAKQKIKKAFAYQVQGKCFSLVEVLSTCPTNWGMAPDISTKWLAENMLPYYPLETFKMPEEEIG